MKAPVCLDCTSILSDDGILLQTSWSAILDFDCRGEFWEWAAKLNDIPPLPRVFLTLVS